MAFNELYDTFESTARFKATGSSFVREVAHDSDENELLVVLDSGTYLYEGVPVSAFRGFETAHSAGQYYNNWIKRGGYGPAEEVYNETEIVEKPVKAPDMGSVTDGGQTFSFTAAANNGEFLSSYTLPNATFSLVLPEPVEEFVYSHKVDYTVGNNSYSTTVEAGKGVFDGIDKVVENLEALGLDYDIKGVYVKVND